MDGIPAELLAQVMTDPEAVAEESAVETPAEPEVAPEPEATPEPTKAEEPDEDMATLEDIKGLIADTLNEFVEAQNKATTTDDDEDTDAAPDSEVAKLRAENAELKQKEFDMLVEAEAQKVEHEVKSTIGKLKMTDAQVEAAVQYANKNPDIVGVWSFERIALRANPELADRPAVEAKPAPESPKVPLGTTRAAGVIVNGQANGPSAPPPFKHNGKPRDYSDVTKHIIKSGLGRDLFIRT